MDRSSSLFGVQEKVYGTERSLLVTGLQMWCPKRIKNLVSHIKETRSKSVGTNTLSWCDDVHRYKTCKNNGILGNEVLIWFVTT